VDGNSDVRAVRPVLPVFFVEQIGLGLEVADFGERQFDLPAVGGFLHRHVAPRGAGGGGAAGVGGNDFAAAGGGAAEVGAQQRATVFCGGGRFPRAADETDFIADETQEAFAGRGRHDGMGCSTWKKFYHEAERQSEMQKRKILVFLCIALAAGTF
jgi:hypothetical protein